jgi:ABC-type transporter lipoprotein component MlaA
MLEPAMPDFYTYIRDAYEQLRKMEKKTPDLITR